MNSLPLSHDDTRDDRCTAADGCQLEGQGPDKPFEKQGTKPIRPLENDTQEKTGDATLDVPYSVFSGGERALVIVIGSFAALISPLSSSIYLPALNSLAYDMDVSVSLINLTITSYLVCQTCHDRPLSSSFADRSKIFQGLAPSFIGSFSDSYGRRPAYIIALLIYLGANIALALQDNYAALLVLRCIQSSGSSGTIALGSAVVSDCTTRAERGKYVGYAGLGIALGPALGPVLGGILDHFLGWRAIFWFLVILSGVCLLAILLFFPETCRAVVGNGSVTPARWNQPLWTFLARGYRPPSRSKDHTRFPIKPPTKRPNPISSLLILTRKESGLILFYGGLTFAGYVAILTTLTTELKRNYGFNSIQVGLCYLPLGVGSICSRWMVGRLLDWNFHREARLQGMSIQKNRQQDIGNFNVERARLAILIPLVYIAGLCILAYGWVMHYRTSLAGPTVMLLLLGVSNAGTTQILNTLVVDINHHQAATATAASNLCRCLMAAGATAFVTPLINVIGLGWTGTIIAATWVAFSPLLWMVYLRGYAWRKPQIASTAE